jgi:hypothetical protein
VNCQNQEYTGIHHDGGYAEVMIAKASGLVSIPDALSSVDAAPLLCAGLTTFSALRNAPAKAGDLVAVLGIGGLGHLGVQYARHMGFEVAAISRGIDTAELAKKLDRPTRPSGECLREDDGWEGALSLGSDHGPIGPVARQFARGYQRATAVMTENAIQQGAQEGIYEEPTMRRVTMSGLLDSIVKTHLGLDRWWRFNRVEARRRLLGHEEPDVGPGLAPDWTEGREGAGGCSILSNLRLISRAA